MLTSETLISALGDAWSPAEVEMAAKLLADGQGRFPGGAKGLPPGLVPAVQRERILAAMLRAAAELGLRNVSVQSVIERAGVSRPTFYEHFENKEDCFLAAFETASKRLVLRLGRAAGETAGDWRDALRRALGELLRFVAAEPDTARALIVEARTARPPVQLRREAALDRLAGCIDARARAELPRQPSPLAALGVVGGIESLLYTRLRRGEAGDVESLLPSLLCFAIVAFEGREAAGEALASAALG